MKLPIQIIEILKLFEDNGFEAYVVGGAVRDEIMGKVPNDYDVCTNALPEEMKEILKDCFIIDFGAKHGTIKIFYNKMPMEITTYRIDGEYNDNRHPSKVVFISDLKSDLSRRDFTINAIAFNKEYKDYFHGMEDIKNKIIRTVGVPKERFTEDALRILRAIRFSSTLNFEIEIKTKKAIHECAYLISDISKERIVSELNKMIETPIFYKVFEEYFDVFSFIINEYNNLDLNIKNRIIKMLKISSNNRIVRYAIMLYPFIEEAEFGSKSDLKQHSAHKIVSILRKLSFSNQDIRSIFVVCSNLDLKIENNEVLLRKLLRRFNSQDLIRIMDMKEIMSKIKAIEEDYTEIKNQVRDLVYRYGSFDLSLLKINGDNLIKLGFSEGKEIREILEDLLDKVIMGTVKNTKTELIKYVKENKEV